MLGGWNANASVDFDIKGTHVQYSGIGYHNRVSSTTCAWQSHILDNDAVLLRLLPYCQGLLPTLPSSQLTLRYRSSLLRYHEWARAITLVELVRLSLENCEVEKDVIGFIKDQGTGQEIPDPPKYINFCRGDVSDTESQTEWTQTVDCGGCTSVVVENKFVGSSL